MGFGNILWKFELDQSIFLDFTGIESFKYKEIRVSVAKLFEEYIREGNFTNIRRFALLRQKC